MKYQIILLTAIPILVMIGFLFPAHAQLSQYYGDTSVIQGGAQKNCTNVLITGSAGTTPFTMTMIFNPTTTASITNSAGAVYQKSDQTLVWFTNNTDHFTLKAVLNYDTDAKRDVFMRYSANGAVTQEDLQYSGTTFCRIFDITTQPPVHILTREEILGQDILDVPKTLNNLVATQQYNTDVEGKTFSAITLMIYVVVGLFVIFILLFASFRGQSRSSKLQISETLRTVRTMAQDNITTNSDMKKIYLDLVDKLQQEFRLFGGFLVELKNTMIITTQQREKLEKLLEQQKKIEAPKPEPEKKKGIVREIYDKVAKMDTKSLLNMLRGLRNKSDEDSKTEAEMIESELKKRGDSSKNNIEDVSKQLDSIAQPEKTQQLISDTELENIFQKIIKGESKMEEIDDKTLNEVYTYKSTINKPDDFDWLRKIWDESKKRWQEKNKA